jgi:hypothetical protein
VAKSALIAAVLAAAVTGAVAASDLQAFVNFAFASEGKFASELPPIASPFFVRAKLTPADWALPGRYDQASSQFVESSPSLPWKIVARRACEERKGFVGQDGRGAKAKVRVLKCVDFIVKDADGDFPLGNRNCSREDFGVLGEAACDRIGQRFLEWPMTPDQYRAMRAKGVVLEVAFLPGKGAEDEVTRRQEIVDAATVENPVEIRSSVYTVHGTLQEIKVFSADGKTQYAHYRRD